MFLVITSVMLVLMKIYYGFTINKTKKNMVMVVRPW